MRVPAKPPIIQVKCASYVCVYADIKTLPLADKHSGWMLGFFMLLQFGSGTGCIFSLSPLLPTDTLCYKCKIKTFLLKLRPCVRTDYMTTKRKKSKNNNKLFCQSICKTKKCRTKSKTCSISKQIKSCFPFLRTPIAPTIKHWKIIKKFSVELMEIELQTRLKDGAQISLKFLLNNLKINE